MLRFKSRYERPLLAAIAVWCDDLYAQQQCANLDEPWRNLTSEDEPKPWTNKGFIHLVILWSLIQVQHALPFKSRIWLQGQVLFCLFGEELSLGHENKLHSWRHPRLQRHRNFGRCSLSKDRTPGDLRNTFRVWLGSPVGLTALQASWPDA